MNNLKLITITTLFPVLISFPQSYNLSGSVFDSITAKPLAGANIVVYLLPDSVIYGTVSDKNGNVKLQLHEKGSYIYSISYMGYKSHKGSFTLSSQNINLGKIFLSPAIIETGEVEVVGKIPPVLIKGDTTEYNADAFKTHPDASAHDLVKKLPGINVTDDKVKSQGEEIKQVLVDGRPLFSGSPQSTLKKLPAEMIEKVQVYDKKSEQAEFTGIDDGELSKAMNLITRKKYKNSIIGKALAGYGTNKKYNTDLTTNIFKDYRRIGISGKFNNVNSGFLSEELSSETRRVSNLISPSGITEGGYVDVNYSDLWGENIDVYSGYSFSTSKNSTEKSSERIYVAPALTGQNYSENTNSGNDNVYHGINLKMSIYLDSTSQLVLTPNIRFSNRASHSNVRGITLANNFLLNSISSFSNRDNSGYRTGSNFLYRELLAKPGRIFSVAGGLNYNDFSGGNNFFSENFYGTQNADTINQSETSENISSNYAVSVGLVEPLTPSTNITFKSDLMIIKTNPDNRRYNIYGNGNLLLDTTLSNYSSSTNTIAKFSAAYRYNDDIYKFSLNLTSGFSGIKYEQSLPYLSGLTKSFFLLQPSILFSYYLSRDKYFSFDYRLTNRDPSASQLETTVNNANPVSLTTGNPDLKQETNHSFSFRYSSLNKENYHSLRASVFGSMMLNRIVSSRIFAISDTTAFGNVFLKKGSYLTYPVNQHGSYSIRGYLDYSLPVEFIKSNIGFNLSTVFSRIPALINGVSSFTLNRSYGAELQISSNISSNLDFSITSGSNYILQENEGSSYKNDYLTHNTSGRFNILLFERLTISWNMNYQYTSNLPAGFDKNIYLIDAGIGVKVFPDKAGEFRLNVFDVLDKNRYIRRTTDDIYIEDESSNSLGRYFLLSFTYNLKYFP